MAAAAGRPLRIAVNGWFAGQLATGSGQYLAGLASWLPAASREHEWLLVLPATAAQSADADSASLPGWRRVRAGTPFDGRSENLGKLWFEQIAFPRACLRVRADVALVPYWGSSWWRPCPIVVTVHDVIPALLPLYRGGIRQQAYTWLVRRTAARAAAVLTDSAAGRRDIVALMDLPPGRVHAIHLAVDPRFKRVSDEAELSRVRASYRLPPGQFLLYVGGFDVRKNVPRLLAAYSRLADRQPEAIPPLVIAGRVPPTDSAFTPDPRPIAARLGLSDQVHFTGGVDEADKPALYSLATATLFISDYEGFGLPVLEAQACGCPVITSR
jgi:glycosyltransferase involved in cell wall biosynthesis